MEEAKLRLMWSCQDQLSPHSLLLVSSPFSSHLCVTGEGAGARDCILLVLRMMT